MSRDDDMALLKKFAQVIFAHLSQSIIAKEIHLISLRIKISLVAAVLELTEIELIKQLKPWRKEIPFEIDGDIIFVRDIEDFTAAINAQFGTSIWNLKSLLDFDLRGNEINSKVISRREEEKRRREEELAYRKEKNVARLGIIKDHASTHEGMMKINPKELVGNWAHGWALDKHTISSILLENRQFNNKRSEIGEAVFQLKYRNDKSKIEPISLVLANFIKQNCEFKDISVILPTPPSNMTRSFQPVFEIAKSIGNKLGIQVDMDFLQKIKQTPQMKNLDNKMEEQGRLEALHDAFKVKDVRFTSCNVMLVDDIFGSGKTLNEICRTLNTQGKVGKIFVVVATYKRSSQ